MSENSNHSDSELHLFNQESFGEILKDLEPDTRCLINAGVDTLTNSHSLMPLSESHCHRQEHNFLPTTVIKESSAPEYYSLPRPHHQTCHSFMELPRTTAIHNAHCNNHLVSLPPLVSPPETLLDPPLGDKQSPVVQRQCPDGLFEGELKFKIDILNNEKMTKNIPWVYSSILNRLYIQRGVQCVFRFKVTHLPEPLYVRAVPMFLDHQSRANPVTTCHVHRDTSTEHEHNGTSWVQVAKDTTGVTTVQDLSGHFTIRVPWFVSDTTLDIMYSFNCRNTCIGGPNRRKTALAFTLENFSGEILAKQMVEVKVIASPGRDKQKDELRHNANDQTGENTASLTKRKSNEKRVTFASKKKYKHYIGMDNDKTYEILLPLRDSLDFVHLYSPTSIQNYQADKPPLKSALAIKGQGKSALSVNTLDQSGREAILSPIRHPDSTKEELPCDMPKSGGTGIFEWLATFNCEAYTDTFVEAGYTTLDDIREFTMKDIDKLRIASRDGRLILNNLASQCHREQLSQPSSQGEAIGLLDFRSNRKLAELRQYSSSED